MAFRWIEKLFSVIHIHCSLTAFSSDVAFHPSLPSRRLASDYFSTKTHRFNLLRSNLAAAEHNFYFSTRYTLTDTHQLITYRGGKIPGISSSGVSSFLMLRLWRTPVDRFSFIPCKHSHFSFHFLAKSVYYQLKVAPFLSPLERQRESTCASKDSNIIIIRPQQTFVKACGREAVFTFLTGQQ